jgi:hypothetical protein
MKTQRKEDAVNVSLKKKKANGRKMWKWRVKKVITKAKNSKVRNLKKNQVQ